MSDMEPTARLHKATLALIVVNREPATLTKELDAVLAYEAAREAVASQVAEIGQLREALDKLLWKVAYEDDDRKLCLRIPDPGDGIWAAVARARNILRDPQPK